MKQFTINDVQSVTKACYVTGVEEVWCHILFTDCETPHEFYASPDSEDAFSRDMYARLKAGEFGQLHHGTGEWYRTMPATQEEVELAVKNKRNQLLLESDYTELPLQQEKMTTQQKAAWSAYREALRDLPNQTRFPWDPVWPTKP